MIGFESRYPVALSMVSDTEFELMATMRFSDGATEYVVPMGYRTNFASTPRSMQALIPAYGQWASATVLHDKLCEDARAGVLTRREADRIFRVAMQTLEQTGDRHPVRRWIMWTAVRWGGFPKTGAEWKREQWYKDAPIVLGVSLFLLPFIAVVAVVNGICIGAIRIIDYLVTRGR